MFGSNQALFRYNFTRIATFGICSLLLLFFSQLLTSVADAQATLLQASQVSLQVQVGFERAYRGNLWTPVFVSLNNDGEDFQGKLSVKVFTGPPRTAIIGIASPWSFEQAISIPGGETKQATIHVPFYLGNLIPRGVIVELRNTQGQVVANTTYPDPSSRRGLYDVDPGELFIGLLTDSSDGFEQLSRVSLRNQQNSPTLSRLDATNFPTMATVLAPFDIIILDNFPTGTLSREQIDTLQTWVNQGGVLIAIGGPNWQQTLGGLPDDLLPVKINGTTTLSAGTAMLPIGSPNPIPPVYPKDPKPFGNKLPQSIEISTAAVRPLTTFYEIKTVLAAPQAPLIIQGRQGQGVVSYIAFDPTTEPFLNWIDAKTNINTGTRSIWQTILLNALGDKFLISSTAPFYSSGPGQLLTRGGIVRMVEPEGLLGPWLLIICLIGYILFIGPVRYLIVRKRPRPHLWSWRIFLSSVVVFSVLSYTLAYYQRGTAFKDNSISIVQFNQSGSAAHITSYMGVYVPNSGSFTMHVPGESLVYPITTQVLQNLPSVKKVHDEASTVISYDQNGTTLKRQASGLWTFHPFVVEQDRKFNGKLTAELAINNNRIIGTITNGLSTSLSDVYVLLPRNFANVGNLAAGETRQINLPISGTSSLTGGSLTEQLIKQGGLSTNYFPYTKSEQPQNDYQRHMALLSALNGNGFSFKPCEQSCRTHSVLTKDTIFLTGGRVPNPDLLAGNDPLLIPDAPATLIGWTSQDITGMNEVTIDGNRPLSRHENLIQMPVNIDLVNPAKTPLDFIPGRITDIQSYDAQVALPGLYTMSSGNVLFDFTLPNISRLPITSFTITQPDLIAHPQGPGSGGPRAISYLQGYLYNWQTQSWDAVAFQQDRFTSSNLGAYVSPTGQILLEITKQKDYKGKLFFRQPTLSLNTDGSP